MKQSIVYKYRYYFIILFIVLIGGISLGYSKLMASLNIDANVNVGGVRWDISFKDISVTSGSFTNDNNNYVRIDPEHPNKLSFVITLNEPGNFYEFTVKVKNSGTMNAILDSINLTGTEDSTIIDTPYIDYTMEGLPSVGSTLNKDGEKTIRVKIEYLPNLGGTTPFTVEKGIELNYIEN
ncbi:MAG: hypothetical protein IKF36_03955 [Bacilli bacterium]|nr:hypothetical protein [Bacilli bacterium]